MLCFSFFANVYDIIDEFDLQKVQLFYLRLYKAKIAVHVGLLI